MGKDSRKEGVIDAISLKPRIDISSFENLAHLKVWLRRTPLSAAGLEPIWVGEILFERRG